MKIAITTTVIIGILVAAYFMLRKKKDSYTKADTGQPEKQNFTDYSGYFYK